MVTGLRSAWLSFALLAGALGADAAVIFRWVDESGRTHMSDTVPERYRASATRIDPGQYQLSPAQLEEAQARAAREKEKALAADAERRRSAAQSLPPAGPASGPATGNRPATPAQPAGDCAARWRLYNQSEACFAPFRTVGGGIKAEAFDRCKPVASPELQCGPQRLR